MKQVMDEIEEQGVLKSHMLFLNFEDLEYAHLKNAMDLYQYVKEYIKDDGKYYLFLDEIQNVAEKDSDPI